MQNQKMNEKKPRDIIAIYSPRMAGYLMMRGFYLVGVSPNKKQPGKNCDIVNISWQIKLKE